ncbi:hypothetical protein PPERSA_01592 [Pseudocohnilembus persalinus]|uniref:EF-hand domain-containing protein n=1 Tax=Pseudocohnilembus persalinus TaxID=266149 RepID=A0A0V0QHW7_PSEPJ|nr:hypothetical protein PPERSA_01592 [Pseudocohnilembus persalinus]|eukprot:KRX01722.1 hypothetical protein PPERSA_01592 [Pseudocohnilembus persalinus]
MLENLNKQCEIYQNQESNLIQKKQIQKIKLNKLSKIKEEIQKQKIKQTTDIFNISINLENENPFDEYLTQKLENQIHCFDIQFFSKSNNLNKQQSIELIKEMSQPEEKQILQQNQKNQTQNEQNLNENTETAQISSKIDLFRKFSDENLEQSKIKVKKTQLNTRNNQKNILKTLQQKQSNNNLDSKNISESFQSIHLFDSQQNISQFQIQTNFKSTSLNNLENSQQFTEKPENPQNLEQDLFGQQFVETQQYERKIEFKEIDYDLLYKNYINKMMEEVENSIDDRQNQNLKKQIIQQKITQDLDEFQTNVQKQMYFQISQFCLFLYCVQKITQFYLPFEMFPDSKNHIVFVQANKNQDLIFYLKNLEFGDHKMFTHPKSDKIKKLFGQNFMINETSIIYPWANLTQIYFLLKGDIKQYFIHNFKENTNFIVQKLKDQNFLEEKRQLKLEKAKNNEKHFNKSHNSPNQSFHSNTNQQPYLSKQSTKSKFNNLDLQGSITKKSTQSGNQGFRNRQQQIEQIQKEKKIAENLQKLQGELAESQATGVPFLLQGDKNIPVDFHQVNYLLGIVEQSNNRKGKRSSYFPKYDPKQINSINSKTVKQKIKLINPNYKLNEINNMFPKKGEVNAHDLTDFLEKNQINEEEFPEGDPMTLALMQFFENGSLNFTKISDYMDAFGYSKLTKNDVNSIKQLLDLDEDGQITMEDLQLIFTQQNLEEIKKQHAEKQDDLARDIIKNAFNF